MSSFPTGAYHLGAYGAFVAYGSLNLTELSPEQSFLEPLSTDDVFHFMRITPAQTDDVPELNEIEMYISAAREQAEILQNRDLVRKQWDLVYDYWPGYRIETRTPLVSVDLVQYMDSNGNITALTENTDYIVDKSKKPGIIAPPYNGTWPVFTPWPSSAILFRFTSGYSSTDPFWRDAGARIKNGMLQLISGWKNNKIPFEIGASAVAEYPYTVTSCLGYGAQVRAR